MGKEGRDAVEHILTTFGVLDKNNHLNISSDKILEIEKINDSCLVKLDKNNCQVKLNVSAKNSFFLLKKKFYEKE